MKIIASMCLALRVMHFATDKALRVSEFATFSLSTIHIWMSLSGDNAMSRSSRLISHLLRKSYCIPVYGLASRSALASLHSRYRRYSNIQRRLQQFKLSSQWKFTMKMDGDTWTASAAISLVSFGTCVRTCSNIAHVLDGCVCDGWL
jgi:hypothetical protein